MSDLVNYKCKKSSFVDSTDDCLSEEDEKTWDLVYSMKIKICDVIDEMARELLDRNRKDK